MVDATEKPDPGNWSLQPGPIVDGVLPLHLSGQSAEPFIDRVGYEKIAAQLRCAAVDEKTRVVVLHGAHGCFCRGGDIGEFLDTSCHDGLIGAVSDFFHVLAGFSKPLLAVVDGEASGVGCSVLFHCDMVIATPESSFAVPFVDFGLVPEAATSILAPERLGYRKAFRFFCLGEALGGEAAYEFGLVTELASKSGLEMRVSEICRRLSRKPPSALQSTKRLLKSQTQAIGMRIDEEVEMFRECLHDVRTRRRLSLIAHSLSG